MHPFTAPANFTRQEKNWVGESFEPDQLANILPVKCSLILA